MGLKRCEWSFYYYYFIIHIVITVCIDSFVVFSDGHPFQKLIGWHIAQNNDFLLWERPSWLYWFVVFELIFQLPLFFIFAKVARNEVNDWDREEGKARSFERIRRWSPWLRAYGYNASLTSLACIIAVIVRGYYPGSPSIPLSNLDKTKLVSFYAPTFLIPLRLIFI